MMTIIEAMAARRSTRSFDGRRISAAESRELSAMLESVAAEETPFGNSPRLALYDCEEDSKPVRLGTYGLVSGVSAYIVPAMTPGPGALEDSGYIIEKAVLEATAMGYASCWIGGVFSRGKASAIVAVAGGELVPAVIALGRPAARRSLADRIVRGAAKSRSRRALDSLVFSVDGGVGAATANPSSAAGSPAIAEPWLGVVEAMRDAPSASNKQPWRLVKVPGSDEWLMFLDEDRVYNNSLGEVHIQNIDIGIGMRHFKEAAAAAGLRGRWMPARASDGALDVALRYGAGRGWTPISLWR
ncbi:MAG TPA: nitroreductase family protein [Rectinemataceae bacterium]|nr:nitroreductase family protein [Rectinemataceae bacterium]